MIRFERVAKHYGHGRTSVAALRGIDLEFDDGEMCALMGPSGAGKSTVLHLAAGLATPDQGAIWIDAQNVARLNEDERTLLRRRQIGIVFQFFNLLPYLTAFENIALPLRFDGCSAHEEHDRVAHALRMVGMTHREHHRPHELSGGELQRIAIARALVIRPRIVLADEPTGNLDSQAGRQIMDLLRDINEQTHVTIVIVTHDPVWASVCDRVVRLVDGRIDQDIAIDDDTRSAKAGR
jgi:putative ABC transport system ATP-binding protein